MRIARDCTLLPWKIIIHGSKRGIVIKDIGMGERKNIPKGEENREMQKKNHIR